MIRIGKYKVFFGDFHGQWNASEEEMALLVAGLWYHGFDFSVFQTPERYDFFTDIIKRNNIPFEVFPGKEYMYEWGHLTTVNVKGKPPDADCTDYEKVLAWFKENTDWVVLAHPYDFMLNKLEGLLDRNLLDAVELVNGHLNSNRNLSLISWYRNLLRKGKQVPIVSGLDIHIPTGSRRPGIMYSESYPPSADIGALGSHRTGVIAQECTVESIKRAIKNRKTFIETSGGRLIGPPEIIEYLDKNGYSATVEKEIGQRRNLIPAVTGMITGKERIVLNYNENVREAIVAGRRYTFDAACQVTVKVPLVSHRNTQYVNIVSRSGKNTSVSVMKIYHPVQEDVFSNVCDKKVQTIIRITNVSTKKLHNLILKVSCGKQKFYKNIREINPNDVNRIVNRWKIEEPLRPSRFDISIDNRGMKKSFCKHLIFMECPYIKNPARQKEWENVPPVKMSGDFPEQVDTNFTVYWNGNDDLSADIRTAWNEKALYFKFSVRDDVLAPSKTELLMFADSFQIGINPVGTEAVGNQSFYDIMMSRGTENSREKAYMERPVDMALEYPQRQRLLLEGMYKGTVEKQVFDGLLTVPFYLIPPMQAVPGYRFGLYYILFDNDGKGLKTAFQWPLHSERYVRHAWYVPYYGAWAGVLLKG